MPGFDLDGLHLACAGFIHQVGFQAVVVAPEVKLRALAGVSALCIGEDAVRAGLPLAARASAAVAGSAARASPPAACWTSRMPCRARRPMT